MNTKNSNTKANQHKLFSTMSNSDGTEPVWVVSVVVDNQTHISTLFSRAKNIQFVNSISFISKSMTIAAFIALSVADPGIFNI
jgi:hypothetical protein